MFSPEALEEPLGQVLRQLHAPGGSPHATKAIRQTVEAWQLRCRIDKTVDDLARMFNPDIRRWVNNQGRYYKSALYPTLRHLDRGLVKWAMAKYKRLRRHRRRTAHWLTRIAQLRPGLFARWRLDDKSWMSREAHVRIRERLGVRFPRATRLVVCCAGDGEAPMQVLRQVLE